MTSSRTVEEAFSTARCVEAWKSASENFKNLGGTSKGKCLTKERKVSDSGRLASKIIEFGTPSDCTKLFSKSTKHSKTWLVQLATRTKRTVSDIVASYPLQLNELYLIQI